MRFLPTGARVVVILTRQGRVLKEGDPVVRRERRIHHPDPRDEVTPAPVGNIEPADAGQRRTIPPVQRQKTDRNRTVSNTIYCGNICSIRFICIPQGHEPTRTTTT
jgi:hypothetical protein